MPRMIILTKTQQNEFNKPPQFNSHERKRFFDFSTSLLDIARRLRKPINQIEFLVACGYFKATKKFYSPQDYHQRDMEFIARSLAIEPINLGVTVLPESTTRHYRQLILSHFGFTQFNDKAERYIKTEITELVRSQLKPNLIFWRSVDLLIKKSIALPSYSQLSELILALLNQRKNELTEIIKSELDAKTQEVLDSLFVQQHTSNQDEISMLYARYKLTLLKRLSQSTRPAKVKERANDLVYLKELHDHLENLLPVLKLSHDGIRYYASSVIKSDIFHLRQRAVEDQYVHLIAFITYQYYRLQDNLSDVLLTVMQSHHNSVVREHREWCYQNIKRRNKSLKSLLNVLDEGFFSVISDIREALENSRSTDTEKVTCVQQLLITAQSSVDKGEALKQELTTQIETNNQTVTILKSKSLRLQNRITPIIKVLDIQGEKGSTALMLAVSHSKKKDGVITKSAPAEFMDEEQRAAVNADGRFNPSLYKTYLFMHIAMALKSGMINLKHSNKYRPLDDYMISKERWLKDRNQLMERADLKEFDNLPAILKQLDEALYQQYTSTNNNYLAGNNPHLKISANGAFTISTPKQTDDEDSIGLKSYFPDHPISLVEILSTTNQHTNFLEEFQHWQQRYTRNNTTDKALFAGIIGKGCAIGTPKIARISNQVNENNLTHIINWYFSLENIRSANDRVIELMNKMELPEIYRRSKDRLHTASDGQKITVRTESLNASHSYKYFGKEQDASAYSFIDERNFLWHSLVFSAAERESAYVIDGLMHNDVVKSDIHSTDTHGYSEAIFATTHLLGFSYAPRIKNLKKQTLYLFKSKSKKDHPEWKITPGKYVNTAVIKENWDDILRLVASIKLKETSASEIFRRLNSYSKQHKLYQGLKAFGQIIKSLFILGYLDDVELRQAIEKQLNKVELANRFTKAVAVGDPGGFTQAEKEEQEIAESCNRLIKNCIICWNYLYLSDKLSRFEENSVQWKTLYAAIASHSVMSWAHINMLGEYDFSDEKLQDSFGIRPPKLLSQTTL